MTHLRLGVLGSLYVALDNAPVAKLESDKTRALLVYLAVEADRPHRREALTGLLWPDIPEETARHNLRQALFNLRRAIGDHAAKPPYLFITRDEIQFNAASDHTLDVTDLHAHLAACERHSHPRLETCAICAPHLQQAVDLYRGKFLQEFFLADSAEFEEWAVARREMYHQWALDALTHLANYYEQRGDPAATRRQALRQLELDPWREPAHRQLMRLFASQGQHHAALAQYETCRRVLADELGVEPSSETRELYEHIRDGSWNLEDTSLNHQACESVGLEFSTSNAQRPSSDFQLPTHLTSFVGRERELADLGRLIADPTCRCVTLVGPGGMGKTRLAIQVAADQHGVFAQGAAFVQLAAIHSADSVVPAIADALGFSFYGPTSPRIQLFNYLRDKQMLLVLDNVEQLVDAAQVFVELLQHASGIKLLLTSREPLDVQGEWVFEVAGLDVPASEHLEGFEASSAVTLFVQRARRTRTGFALNDRDRAAVARLCHLVDGMPLALELAATWVKTLSVSEIVMEIEHSPDFLSASIRDLPERHRSVRAVFDHSWQRLPVLEQRALAKLSVFRGDFQREAADQVAGAGLALLSALVAKSLVRRTAAGRYDLHELVGQYAAHRLIEDIAEETATREQHSRYYLMLVQERQAALFGHRQVQAVAELNAEMDNLRAAWQWAATRNRIDLMRPCARAIYWYYDLRNLTHEGATLFELAIANTRALAVDDPAVETGVGHWLAFQAMLTFRQNRLVEAKRLLGQSLELLERHGDRAALMDALWIGGQVTWALGEYAEAMRYLTRALDLGDARPQWQTAICLILLGTVEYELGNYADSYRSLAESLRVSRAQGDPTLISYAISSLSRPAHQPGRIDELETLLREGCQLAKESGNRFAVGLSLAQLAQIVWAKGDPEQAKRLCRESITVCRDQGDDWGLSATLNQLANFEMADGKRDEAERYLTEAVRVAFKGGFHANVLDALVSIAAARAKSGNAASALEIVTQVLQDPATKYQSQSRARQLRAELESRLPAQQVENAHAEARVKRLDQIVEELLQRNQ